MLQGTSPNIAALAGGGYQVAFQANTSSLWTTGSAGTSNSRRFAPEQLLPATVPYPNYRLRASSSGVTRACFRMPRSVPIASSRCNGTTQPISPSGVCLFNTT